MLADTADHRPPPPHHHRSRSSFEFTDADKLFSKLRSKESSINTRNPSFRVYYGGSTGSVPFKWETTPGMPKHILFHDDDVDRNVVPPLTPPPSFFKSGRESERRRGSSKAVVSGFVMRRITSAKAHVSPSSCESVSSDSSGDVERKAPIRNWRSLSVARFSMPFGKGDAVSLNLSKTTSFGGCFRS